MIIIIIIPSKETGCRTQKIKGTVAIATTHKQAFIDHKTAECFDTLPAYNNSVAMAYIFDASKRQL